MYYSVVNDQIESLWLPGAVDTHCHLDHVEKKGIDVPKLLREADTARFGRLIDVGITPPDLDGRRARFASPDLVSFTSGLHPTEVTPKAWSDAVLLLEQQLQESENKVVAVGECGIDLYWSDEHYSDQLAALTAQAHLASQHELPLILHNRSSEHQMLSFLRDVRPLGIMHCFSQDEEYCHSCVDLDMYVSFGGNLTYKKSNGIRAAAAIVPDELLLVETDAPYLSPQTVRGKMNHSGHLGFTIHALAEIRETTAERIAEITATNARRLFRLE